ncbi:MAG: hypothetical protein IIA49_06640 [Bacteroidetes bacterium]|nr:hypothetical protein [Bacteroidota bacterium]MCH7770679.1 hypothetical protein [Bacteroidota bacterium]
MRIDNASRSFSKKLKSRSNATKVGEGTRVETSKSFLLTALSLIATLSS